MIQAEGAVGILDWLVIVAYLMGVVLIAVYQGRRIHAQDDYFLAGRSMSRWPIALSLYMALFSTNSFLGVTGWVSRPDGTVWVGLLSVGVIMAVPLVVVLYPTIFHRLNITTAYEYLERRFNYSVRAFAAIFFLANRSMWMATMTYAAGLVLSQMLGWTTGDFAAVDRAIVLVALIGTLLAVTGGMRAVIWTDAVQFFVLFGGVCLMGGIAIWSTGGLSESFSRAAEAGKFAPPPFAAVSGFSIFSALMLGFFSYLSAAGSDQVLLQTYLSAKSEKEAKSSLVRNGFLLKPFSLIFPFLGLFLFVYYQAHPEIASLMRVPDDAVPVFVRHVLPVGLRGIIIAAILSAVFTSLGSGLAAWSACVQVDFLRRWDKRRWSERRSVVVGRLLVATGGLTILCSALMVRRLGQDSNIIEVLNVVMYPFAGVLLGVFLLGLLTLRAAAPGTLIGGLLGFAANAATPIAGRILSLVESERLDVSPPIEETIRFVASISNFYSAAIGAIVTFAAGYLISLFFKSPAADRLRGLTLHTQSLSGPAATLSRPGQKDPATTSRP